MGGEFLGANAHAFIKQQSEGLLGDFYSLFLSPTVIKEGEVMAWRAVRHWEKEDGSGL